MLISKFVPVIAGLFFSYALAAPTKQPPKHSFKEAAHAVSMMHKIDKTFNPAPHEAVFYTGRNEVNGKTKSVHRSAQKYAHETPGKSSLEQTLRKNQIVVPKEKHNRYSNHIWKKASKVLADRSKGNIHAILGGSTRPNSVYHTVEKPGLMKNKHVTALFEHNDQTGKITVAKRPARASTAPHTGSIAKKHSRTKTSKF